MQTLDCNPDSECREGLHETHDECIDYEHKLILAKKNIDYAIRYAEMGFHVFPVWGIQKNKEDIECTCGLGKECTSPGKHPVGKWTDIATTDPTKIKAWWDKFPDANIGIATGKISNIIVIDVDIKPKKDDKNGVNSFNSDINPHLSEEDRNTLVVTSGSGGFHIYYQYDNSIKTSVGTIGTGIDIKSDGGYIIAPPSTHICGNQYQFKQGFDLWRPFRIAPVPLFFKRTENYKPLQKSNLSDETIIDGKRHDTLLSIGGTMRRKGCEYDEIFSLLSTMNKNRCKPVLPDHEIVTLAKSLAKYGPEDNILITPLALKHNISEDEFKNISFNETTPIDLRLSNENFVQMYIRYASSLSDSYKDYHFSVVLTMLSVLAGRKIYIHLTSGKTYPNIWSMILGQSTISRKSTAINYTREFNHILNNETRKEAPNQFSPEGLMEHLSMTPHSHFILDEAAGLLKSMKKKTYLIDLRDLLCTLYDCQGVSRKLRTSRTGVPTSFNVLNPFISMICGTTPGNIERYSDYEDMASGYLLRFLYFYPRYKRDYKPITEISRENVKEKNHIAVRLTEIDNTIKKLNNPLNFILSEEARKYFTEWNRKMDNKAGEHSDDIIQSGIGRLEIYALKLAILYEIGEEKFSANIKNLQVQSVEIFKPVPMTYPISINTIREACRNIEEYFLPMLERVAELVQAADETNKQQRVVNAIKKSGGKITRSKLINATRINTKDLKDVIDSLIESEEIEEKVVKTSTKDMLCYCMKRQ